MSVKRSIFLNLCSAITGYSRFELEGTGLVDSHQTLLENILGTNLSEEFYSQAAGIGELDDIDRCEQLVHDAFLPSSNFWPVLSSLVALWYLGGWNQLPNDWYAQAGLPVPGPVDFGRTHTPSALAYVEQLSYRTASAHPPGAKPTGFASWSWDPA